MPTECCDFRQWKESLLNIGEASPTPSPRRLQLLQNGWGWAGRSRTKGRYQWRRRIAKDPRQSSISRPSLIMYSNEVYSFVFDLGTGASQFQVLCNSCVHSSALCICDCYCVWDPQGPYLHPSGDCHSWHPASDL